MKMKNAKSSLEDITKSADDSIEGCSIEHDKEKLSQEAKALGLEFDPVDFTEENTEFFVNLCSYSLPRRFRHWSFGAIYKKQKKLEGMMGKILEVIIDAKNPKAYLLDENAVITNKMVIAHVYGHADFFKKNFLFAKSGKNIIQKGRENSIKIEGYKEKHGDKEIEEVLDSCLTVCSQTFSEGEKDNLPMYLLKNAPLTDYERDILKRVKEECETLSKILKTQIMNEGWAAFVQDKMMRKTIPREKWSAYCILNSGMLATDPGQLNPYAVGKTLWEDIEEKHGFAKCLDIREQYDDIRFINKFLNKELCSKLGLYIAEEEDTFGGSREFVKSKGVEEIKKALTLMKTNEGEPIVEIDEDAGKKLKVEGLYLRHIFDERGLLKRKRTERFMEAVERLWKSTVYFETKYKGADGLKNLLMKYSKEEGHRIFRLEYTSDAHS